MITIYVIYHNTLEDTNLFTTDRSKIDQLIQIMAEHTNTEVCEWKYKTIKEGHNFYASFNDDCIYDNGK